MNTIKSRFLLGILLANLLTPMVTAQSASSMASRYKSMMSAFTSRSVVSTAALYHEDFYNGGYGFEDICASMGVVFGAKTYKIKLSNFSTTYTEVAMPFGLLQGTMRIREYEGSTLISDGYYAIEMVFASQNSRWYFYGDQSTVVLRSNSTSKDSWKEAFGVKPRRS